MSATNQSNAKRGPKSRKPAQRQPAQARTALPAGWDCPKHLTGDARAAWKHLVTLLDRVGNLERTDPMLVEAYAINVSLLRAAQQSIKSDGVVIPSPQGPKANPACSAINAASMRIKAIAYDLGLTPATSKYGASTSGSAASSKWDGVLTVVNGA